MEYEIVGETLMFYRKEKNGDGFNHTFLEDENILLAMVADGFGPTPCDWMASDVACEKFTAYFRLSELPNLRERIFESINQTNKAMVGLEGDCSGMCTTFSLLVWEVSKKKAWIVNIGDSSHFYRYRDESMIFRIRANKMEEFKVSDGVGQDSNGKTTWIGQQVVSVIEINQYFGSSTLVPNIIEIDIRRGDTLILATDGFYTLRARGNPKGRAFWRTGLSEHLIKLSNCGKDDFAAEFKNVFHKTAVFLSDDKSAVALKIF